MAKTDLTREDILDLLAYCGSPKIVDKPGKNNIQFCCPIHGERHPSAGASIDKQVFNCLSCHESGSFEWLLVRTFPDDFKSIKQAFNFLAERYELDVKAFQEVAERGIIRYEDEPEEEEQEVKERVVLPKFKLAPFRSGKETFPYLLERGFTKETIRDFQIGRDLASKTVTVPIFYEDNELAGFIGRYISKDRRKNERYKIYEVSTGSVLFPMNRFKAINRAMILVEGLLDSLWLHQHGYTNAQAILTNFLSDAQAEWIISKREEVDTIIDMTDCDSMGDTATKSIKDKLGEHFKIVSVKHLYPEECKDPQDCNKEQLDYMISNASKGRRRLSRLE